MPHRRLRSPSCLKATVRVRRGGCAPSAREGAPLRRGTALLSAGAFGVMDLPQPGLPSERCLFLVAKAPAGVRPVLCELNRHSPKYGSWFVGDAVVSDGSLLLATPIDPLFCLLPGLERNAARNPSFMPLVRRVGGCRDAPSYRGSSELSLVHPIAGLASRRGRRGQGGIGPPAASAGRAGPVPVRDQEGRRGNILQVGLPAWARQSGAVRRLRHHSRSAAQV